MAANSNFDLDWIPPTRQLKDFEIQIYYCWALLIIYFYGQTPLVVLITTVAVLLTTTPENVTVDDPVAIV